MSLDGLKLKILVSVFQFCINLCASNVEINEEYAYRTGNEILGRNFP